MFKSIAVIGRGYYGKVTLVKDKETGKKYAMKSIQKKKLLKAHKAHTIVIERDILMKVRKHPFIVSMKFCFQTASKFYVGMQFVPGGDLFHRMRMCGSKETIPIHDVRLYIAEIALALDFLHENEIIYRDLKPENVLIDAQGHIKLVDFGLSKMFGDKNYSNVESHSETSHDHQKAHSICGTPEYNSPEMVLKIPYDYTIDWWSLGILTYDLIFRRTPFYDKNTSKLFQNILESEPKFRENIPIDESTKSFILMLLKKNQSERPSFEQIKSHEFFQGLDFNNVYNKQIQPIYIPNIKKIELNFDREFIEEKAFDSYAPPESDSNVNISDFSCSWLTVSDSETMEKQEY
ncbi:Serine/threonine-protein kinase Sgk1 [Tritrichomonas foetus]|uniref:non-specific serine/threonine protein kinase n=1 Tax=Tritrichomonas foetus TaxID=1144522 RepID=A0A1J4KKB0_9EUKA|nr:Serine/threonine-protein kinase Sgk1 [Tritrichomonas foetus]|eukprot:OHT11392.1 Serine/threonine-protein kinase Sgk1 [Tritrichomonas foetus]